jgi:Na+/H+ antiporter NhaC
VLEMQAQASAATGAPPGVTTGAVSAKTVDKVSVTYDTHRPSNSTPATGT